MRNVHVQIRPDDIWAADIANKQMLRRSIMHDELCHNVPNFTISCLIRQSGSNCPCGAVARDECVSERPASIPDGGLLSTPISQ
jgi:hypothetical protein